MQLIIEDIGPYSTQRTQFDLSLIASHLTTLRNDNIQIRDITSATTRLRPLHFINDIHTINDLAEDDVLPVQMGRGHGRDEELATVRIRARVLLSS